MTEKKVRCDACGRAALEIRYNFVRERDGAGDMETNHDTVDLCHEHMQQELQKMLGESRSIQSISGTPEGFTRWVKEYCRWEAGK